jgi:hypothetical protein
MSLFHGKSVAVVGPCIQSLEKMDFSELDDFDIVMRTNMFFKITNPVKNDTMRCDGLILNQEAISFYAKDNLLETKTDEDFILLLKLTRHMRRHGLKYGGKHEQMRRPPYYKRRNSKGKWIKNSTEPYLCTYAAYHFIDVPVARVKFFGIDFYYNGFNRLENYPDGYWPYSSSADREHRDHSMIEDIINWRDRYLTMTSLITLDSPSSEFFFKQLERMGHGRNNL